MKASPNARWQRFDTSAFNSEVVAPDDKREEAAKYNTRAKKLIKDGWMYAEPFNSLAELKRAVNTSESIRDYYEGLLIAKHIKDGQPAFDEQCAERLMRVVDGLSAFEQDAQRDPRTPIQRSADADDAETSETRITDYPVY